MADTRPEVYIAGIGQTNVGELWSLSLRDLSVKAIRAAIKDSGAVSYTHLRAHETVLDLV